MKTVRIGIIGLGNMGRVHATQIASGKIPRLELVAVCDSAPDKMAPFESAQKFTDARTMIHSGSIDAVLVATPHYDHTTLGIETLKAGLHLLVEKPISVHKADCQRLIAAHTSKKQVFAAMFNQRTDPYYIKIRELLESGELGEIRRVNWIITNWFRTHVYYESGGWRATWKGEGGGVLLNQCPHNLDLFQWMFGMPKTVRAFCSLGKYHNIEVEDDVTAFMEFFNGSTGVFITSTGEAPGTNRLEITAERGRLVYEDDKLTWLRNEVPMSKFSKETDQSFGAPGRWEVNIPVGNHGAQHNGILENFVAAIIDGTPLVAPAAEGIHSVELANAFLYSSFTGKAVEFPLSAPAYEKHLKKLIANSKPIKRKVREAKVEFAASGAK